MVAGSSAGEPPRVPWSPWWLIDAAHMVATAGAAHLYTSHPSGSL